MDFLQKIVKLILMLIYDTVKINFDLYEEVLKQIYNTSSPKISHLFEKSIGLELISSDYDDDGFNFLIFKIIDKEKWFLAKIKYGF